MGKIDFNFDVDDLKRLLPQTEQRRGRGRKCKLTQWLEQNREDFGHLIACGEHSWVQLAQALTQFGLTNGDGLPLIGERLRKCWAEVEKRQAIQPLPNNLVPFAISPPKRATHRLTSEENQSTTIESRMLSLQAELTKVLNKSKGDGFSFAANRLESKLKNFQNEHQGCDSSELVTKFIDESTHKLNVAREVYQRSTPVLERLDPLPEQHLQGVESDSLNQPVPGSDIIKPAIRQTREEFEESLRVMNWSETELKLGKLESELRLLQKDTNSFRNKKEEFEAVLNSPYQVTINGLDLFVRAVEDAQMPVEDSAAAHNWLDLATAQMRLDVVQERIERARSLKIKWREILKYIEFPALLMYREEE